METIVIGAAKLSSKNVISTVLGEGLFPLISPTKGIVSALNFYCLKKMVSDYCLLEIIVQKQL